MYELWNPQNDHIRSQTQPHVCGLFHHSQLILKNVVVFVFPNYKVHTVNTVEPKHSQLRHLTSKELVFRNISPLQRNLLQMLIFLRTYHWNVLSWEEWATDKSQLLQHISWALRSSFFPFSLRKGSQWTFVKHKILSLQLFVLYIRESYKNYQLQMEQFHTKSMDQSVDMVRLWYHRHQVALCWPKRKKNSHVSAWIKQCKNSVMEMSYKRNGSESIQRGTPHHCATNEKSEILNCDMGFLSTGTLMYFS